MTILEDTVKYKFLHKFRELNYESQVSIVRAIRNKSNHYSKVTEKGLCATFNQILLGHRKLPVKMEECLISLSKNDSLIIELCEILRHKDNKEKILLDDDIIESGIYSIIDGNISILKISLKYVEIKTKISLLREFNQSIANINDKITILEND